MYGFFDKNSKRNTWTSHSASSERTMHFQEGSQRTTLLCQRATEAAAGRAGLAGRPTKNSRMSDISINRSRTPSGLHARPDLWRATQLAARRNGGFIAGAPALRRHCRFKIRDAAAVFVGFPQSRPQCARRGDSQWTCLSAASMLCVGRGQIRAGRRESIRRQKGNH